MMRRLALTLSLVTAAVCIVPCPSAVRAVPILLFWAWVPGAVTISMVAGRWLLAPSAPAVAVGTALLVLEAQIALHLHHSLGRGAMVVWPAITAFLLSVSAPERLGRRSSDAVA
jgi:hypothetical protein